MVADELVLDSLPSRFFLFTVNIFKDMVHSLKCPSSCFRYKIVRPDEGQQAEDGEERISPLRDIFESVLRVQGQSWRLHP